MGEFRLGYLCFWYERESTVSSDVSRQAVIYYVWPRRRSYPGDAAKQDQTASTKNRIALNRTLFLEDNPPALRGFRAILWWIPAFAGMT